MEAILKHDTDDLYSKLMSLPIPIKSEVVDYIDFLLKRHPSTKFTNHPKAGCMKGSFVITKDFNDELDCFKEYML